MKMNPIKKSMLCRLSYFSNFAGVFFMQIKNY